MFIDEGKYNQLKRDFQSLHNEVNRNQVRTPACEIAKNRLSIKALQEENAELARKLEDLGKQAAELRIVIHEAVSTARGEADTAITALREQQRIITDDLQNQVWDAASETRNTSDTVLEILREEQRAADTFEEQTESYRNGAGRG